MSNFVAHVFFLCVGWVGVGALGVAGSDRRDQTTGELERRTDEFSAFSIQTEIISMCTYVLYIMYIRYMCVFSFDVSQSVHIFFVCVSV